MNAVQAAAILPALALAMLLLKVLAAAKASSARCTEHCARLEGQAIRVARHASADIAQISDGGGLSNCMGVCLHEALVDGGANVVELGQHSVLDDVNDDLSAEDIAAAPQQLRAGAGHSCVVHFLDGHKHHGQQQVEAFCDILAYQDEELGGVKALEYGACGATEAAQVGLSFSHRLSICASISSGCCLCIMGFVLHCSIDIFNQQ